jgi:hypothetical protein
MYVNKRNYAALSAVFVRVGDRPRIREIDWLVRLQLHRPSMTELL